MRDILSDAEWSDTPALGRYLRECVLRRGQTGTHNQMLVEIRHRDDHTRGPEEFALSHVLLWVHRSALLEQRDIYMLEFDSQIIRSGATVVSQRAHLHFHVVGRTDEYSQK